MLTVNNTGVPLELLKITEKYNSESGEYSERIINFSKRELLKKERREKERKIRKARKSLIRKHKDLLSMRYSIKYVIYEFADRVVRLTQKIYSN